MPEIKTVLDLMFSVYIMGRNIEDRGADDGDGHIDTWMSSDWANALKNMRPILEKHGYALPPAEYWEKPDA